VLHSTVPLSTNQLIIIGRIVHAHASDEIVLDAREPLLDTNAMHLIGGMHGAKWYTRTSDLFAMERPTWSDWVLRGNAKI
jgi:flavin reductase (DIM6/NTAB) family NADH-FMN oxidoreductase RutF